MSATAGQATDEPTSPDATCGDCKDNLLDDELVLDVTGDKPELREASGDDVELDVEDVSDREQTLAERGAEFLGVDSSKLSGMAEMQQANGKRVVKVLSSVGIGVVILNEIFSLDTIANGSGPFAGVIGTIETTGVAALTLIVVGLIAYAGAVAMGYLDMF